MERSKEKQETEEESEKRVREEKKKGRGSKERYIYILAVGEGHAKERGSWARGEREGAWGREREWIGGKGSRKGEWGSRMAARGVGCRGRSRPEALTGMPGRERESVRMERKRIGGEKSKREECVIGRARR